MIARQRFGFEFHIVNAWGFDVVGFTAGFTAEGTSERGDERKDVHGNTIKKAGGAKKAVTLVESELLWTTDFSMIFRWFNHQRIEISYVKTNGSNDLDGFGSDEKVTELLMNYIGECGRYM